MAYIKIYQELDAEAPSRPVSLLTSERAYVMRSINDETHLFPKGKKSWVIK